MTLGSQPKQLELTARFDSSEEIEVAGNLTGLANLADVLRSVSAEARFALDSVSRLRVAPYDGFLTALEVLVTGGDVRIFREGGALCIHGSLRSLQSLAGTIQSLCDSIASSIDASALHVHIEPYPGHPYLSEESQAAIFIFRPPGP